MNLILFYLIYIIFIQKYGQNRFSINYIEALDLLNVCKVKFGIKK